MKKHVSFNLAQTFCFSYGAQFLQGFLVFSYWIPTNADRFLSHCFNYAKLLKKRMRPLSDRHKSKSLRYTLRKKKQQLGCYMGFWRIRCPCRSHKSLTKRSDTWNRGKTLTKQNCQNPKDASSSARVMKSQSILKFLSC